VIQAADPGYDSFDSHAEAGVGDGAVFAQVEVPLEGGERKVVVFDALLEQVVAVDALGAADDLAVALGARASTQRALVGSAGRGAAWMGTRPGLAQLSHHSSLQFWSRSRRRT
jgi:hypothetical protein